MSGLGPNAVLQVNTALLITAVLVINFGYEDETMWERELGEENKYRKAIQICEGIGIVFFGVAWFLYTASTWSFVRDDVGGGDGTTVPQSDYVYPFQVTQAMFFATAILFKGYGWVRHLVDMPGSNPAEIRSTGSAIKDNWWLGLVAFVAWTIVVLAVVILVLICTWYQVINSIIIFDVVALVIVVVLTAANAVMVSVQINRAYNKYNDNPEVKGYVEMNNGGGLSGNGGKRNKNKL